MKRCNFHVILALLALAAILGMAAAGCAPAKQAAPATPAVPITPSAPPAAQQVSPPASAVTLPAVNYFSSTSDTIPPNTVIILVWSVSGAESVSIDNGIGKVNVQGRYTLFPTASTTYILTATNTAGSVTAQTAVEVSELQSASPHYRPGYKISHVGLKSVVGSPITVNLDTQTSDNCQWVVDYYDTTMFSYAGGKYVPQNPLTRGVDGQQQFTFKPLEPGDTRILVSYINDQTPTQFKSIVYDIRISP